MTITLETTRVALAVDPLVVLMNGREGQAAQRMLRDQDGPDSRMGFDHFIFRLGEFAALSQNTIRNTDFADVMQEAAQPGKKTISVGRPAASANHREYWETRQRWPPV